jgi:hypothetical protein
MEWGQIDGKGMGSLHVSMRGAVLIVRADKKPRRNAADWHISSLAASHEVFFNFSACGGTSDIKTGLSDENLK